MSKQNKKLLGDKKALLIQNKLLLDRIGAVREEVTRELVVQIDDLNQKLSKGKQLYEKIIPNQYMHADILDFPKWSHRAVIHYDLTILMFMVYFLLHSQKQKITPKKRKNWRRRLRSSKNDLRHRL